MKRINVHPPFFFVDLCVCKYSVAWRRPTFVISTILKIHNIPVYNIVRIRYVHIGTCTGIVIFLHVHSILYDFLLKCHDSSLNTLESRMIDSSISRHYFYRLGLMGNVDTMGKNHD